jgi:hypothetical protein
MVRNIKNMVLWTVIPCSLEEPAAEDGASTFIRSFVAYLPKYMRHASEHRKFSGDTRPYYCRLDTGVTADGQWSWPDISIAETYQIYTFIFMNPVSLWDMVFRHMDNFTSLQTYAVIYISLYIVLPHTHVTYFIHRNCFAWYVLKHLKQMSWSERGKRLKIHNQVFIMS